MQMEQSIETKQLDGVLRALSMIRAPRVASEYSLHALVEEALSASSLAFAHEVPLAPRRRIDFVSGSVGIEVKRGKPPRTALIRQISAYAKSEMLTALIVVAERAPSLPETLSGKPIHTISLSRLWGIAL